jgi:hypothetical protein
MLTIELAIIPLSKGMDRSPSWIIADEHSKRYLPQMDDRSLPLLDEEMSAKAL